MKYLIPIIVLALIILAGGCQSAASIASAGSGAVATITDDLNQAHTALPGDPKTADSHIVHAQGQLPAVAAMPAEIVKLNDRWNGSYLAGKGTFWFWLIIIVIYFI